MSLHLARLLLYSRKYHFPVMKKLIAVLCFVLPMSLLADTADDVAAAIRTGDAHAVAAYFADNVDLKVLEQENIYSKAQAELILKDFFVKHPVNAFTIVHKSVPKNDSQFAIGTLETTNGKYRVHYLLKTIIGKTSVTQFRIEDSDEEE
jgi:hypothetical protein